MLLVWASVCAGQQESFDELAARARHALEGERVDEAIQLYGRATKIRPDWSEGWWRLATLLYDTRRFTEARDAFTRFTERENKAGPGYAMIGLCEYRLKRYREALTALDKGLQLGIGPNREFAREALYHDAILDSLLGRPDMAIKRLTLLMNQAAAAHPGAGTESLLGDLEAVDALGIAALRIPMLPADVPSGKSALVRQAGRAQALLALQDLTAAAKEFKQLIASYGQEPGVHYMYGVFLLKQNPPEAMAEFRKELEVSPNDVDARVQIAFECSRTGDYALGLKHGGEAVKLSPGNFAAHLALARLWLAADNTGRALEEAQTAVKLAPGSPDAHFTLSRCYAQSNRPQEAERERAEFQRLQQLAERAE